MQPQRALGFCHLLAGTFMLGCWWLGVQAGFGNELPNKSLFITLYTLSVAFFMPTIALANTVAFSILKNNNMDTVKDFPPI
ncbi:MFS transporter, partial [Klebsiella pneumoniae]|nr:MFS transporter [Klebsiella pneumoniae]